MPYNLIRYKMKLRIKEVLKEKKVTALSLAEKIGIGMTISEIAKLAGVSSAAVSRYLNDGSLSQEKRQRIERVIRETKYRYRS